MSSCEYTDEVAVAVVVVAEEVEVVVEVVVVVVVVVENGGGTNSTRAGGLTDCTCMHGVIAKQMLGVSARDGSPARAKVWQETTQPHAVRHAPSNSAADAIRPPQRERIAAAVCGDSVPPASRHDVGGRVVTRRRTGSSSMIHHGVTGDRRARHSATIACGSTAVDSITAAAAADSSAQRWRHGANLRYPLCPQQVN
jgi:hypothetical protein